MEFFFRRLQSEDIATQAGWIPFLVHAEAQALAALGEVHAAVSRWREVALRPDVGLRASELEAFAPAFEHEQMAAAGELLRR